mgnify:CR=1 FL=1
MVIKYFNDYPMFITCCEKSGTFYRIENLEQYLKDGKGVTNEIIDEENVSFVLINDKHNWKNVLKKI